MHRIERQRPGGDLVERSTATVVVIGGQGVLGTHVARALAGDGHEVIRAGRRSSSGAGIRHVDLSDPGTVATACEGADVVVNCAYDAGLTAERWALASGGLLLNVANLTLEDRLRMKRDAAGGPPPRGLVALHGGLTPGINSLVAGALLEEHPDADSVELVMTMSLFESSGPQAAGGFAHRLLTSRSRHPTKVFPLAEPFRTRRCLQVGGAESGAFGELAAGRDARVYFCFREGWFQRVLLALNRLRLMRVPPRGPFTWGLKVPDELSDEPKRDWVVVTRNGRTLGAYLVAGTGDYRMTVAGTAALVDALVRLRRRDPDLRGAFGVDELFELGDVQRGFGARGVEIRRRAG